MKGIENKLVRYPIPSVTCYMPTSLYYDLGRYHKIEILDTRRSLTADEDGDINLYELFHVYLLYIEIKFS